MYCHPVYSSYNTMVAAHKFEDQKLDPEAAAAAASGPSRWFCISSRKTTEVDSAAASRKLDKSMITVCSAKWTRLLYTNLNAVTLLLLFVSLLLVSLWENYSTSTHGPLAFLQLVTTAKTSEFFQIRNLNHSLRVQQNTNTNNKNNNHTNNNSNNDCNSNGLATAAGAADPASPVVAGYNTFLALEDSIDVWSCSEFQRQAGNYTARSFAEWVRANASDEEVMCAAHRAALRPLDPSAGKPRVAFLFMVRGDVPLEPLWRKFFEGNEELYSVYAHPGYPNHTYANDSMFYERQIPSRPVDRIGLSMSEAQRRLLAYALLDSEVPNAWFSLVCDAAIPVRSFGFVYSYLMHSELSFVEAFYAWEWWRQGWTTEAPQLRDEVMRKGESWFSLHRRHAGLIVGDFYVFPKFKDNWRLGGIPSEVYLPTVLNIVDPLGIANHSTTYVNWSNPDTGSHPEMYTRANFSAATFSAVQRQRRISEGMYATGTRYYGFDNQESCVYNGIANSSCWLFARKFSGEPQDVKAILGFADTLIGGDQDFKPNKTLLQLPSDSAR